MAFEFDLSGVKVPKRVAGVKLPKPLRKQAKRLLTKASTPAGREAIAAGLTIAGAAIAAGVKAKAEARAQPRTAAGGPGAASHAAAGSSAASGQAANDAARPGQPGIDPARGAQPDWNAPDWNAPDWNAVVGAGLGALQTFLAGRRAG